MDPCDLDRATLEVERYLKVLKMDKMAKTKADFGPSYGFETQYYC